LAALLRQLQALARHQPVLMIFENLHWIDPTSRDARYRPTELRRRLRKWGLPSGMRRPRCCGHAQGTHQTALSFLRQWRVPCGMRRAKWGRSRAEAIIAEFPGSRGATRQELDGQEPAPIAGGATRCIAASESGSPSIPPRCAHTLDPSVPRGHLIDNRCDQRCFPTSFGSYRNQDPIRSATARPRVALSD
jgi:hypothetical protein